jgi:hypothetical protein
MPDPQKTLNWWDLLPFPVHPVPEGQLFTVQVPGAEDRLAVPANTPKIPALK